jgi:hypothetical protein
VARDAAMSAGVTMPPCAAIRAPQMTRVRGEIVGPARHENVGKSQTVLIVINPKISPRTRIDLLRQALGGAGVERTSGAGVRITHDVHDRERQVVLLHQRRRLLHLRQRAREDHGAAEPAAVALGVVPQQLHLRGSTVRNGETWLRFAYDSTFHTVRHGETAREERPPPSVLVQLCGAL